MVVLVDLSQEHALQRVELCRHLLGEVLQVRRLDHLQTLKRKKDDCFSFETETNKQTARCSLRSKKKKKKKRALRELDFHYGEPLIRCPLRTAVTNDMWREREAEPEEMR